MYKITNETGVSKGQYILVSNDSTRNPDKSRYEFAFADTWDCYDDGELCNFTVVDTDDTVIPGTFQHAWGGIDREDFHGYCSGDPDLEDEAYISG